MKTRSLRDSDIPILQSIAEKTGFPYPDFADPLLVHVVVAVDSDDNPMGACAAKQLLELYGWFDPAQPPSVRGEVLKALHQGMATSLRSTGYSSCEIFLPPQIAKKFGRRLERTFGWVKNWNSWNIRF